METTSELQDDRRTAVFAKSCDEIDEADYSIHAFNVSNVTVIERVTGGLESSDSGVEVPDTVPPQPHSSCGSSLISCSCSSNYDDAYNVLARRNSTLLENYSIVNDCTSEGGSDSSSVAGCLSGPKRNKVVDLKGKKTATSTSRSRPKQPNGTPKMTSGSSRAQSSFERLWEKTPILKPVTLKTKTKPTDNSGGRKDARHTPVSRTTPVTRTPASTPTDDGRWPSVNSKPAPLMTRSMRGILPQETASRSSRLSTWGESSRALEKYATLPRCRKEKLTESIKPHKVKSVTRENGAWRTGLCRSKFVGDEVAVKSLPPYPRKQTPKIKIYHETSSQTAFTLSDIEKAFAGETVSPSSLSDAEKIDKDIQVDTMTLDLEKVQEEIKQTKKKYEAASKLLRELQDKCRTTENELKEERLEKKSLSKELQQNTERVLAILSAENVCGSADDTGSSDGLIILETRFQNAGQVVIRQEQEIAKLNSLCRVLQKDLEKSFVTQKTLLQQHQDLEVESAELQEFMQAEKNALTDALKEAETETFTLKEQLARKDDVIHGLNKEIEKLQGMCERKRQDNFSLQARLLSLEAKTRELFVRQGSMASGAAVALSALISRLNALVEELVSSYDISERDIEEIVFHNEAYNNSSNSSSTSTSPETTPKKSKNVINDVKSSQKFAGSSFVSAVINAIKNAVAQSSVTQDGSPRSSSTEMLDCETEPCLMMEHVLEDVVLLDGFSHNMISSGQSLLGSRLSRSESLNSFSIADVGKNSSLNVSYASDVCSLSELCPSFSVVDQVIEVDNIITKLLKVIRIIQIENDDGMKELQSERDFLKEQIEKGGEVNKTVVRQLKDWEILGARLKTEVKDLSHQLDIKNGDIDILKSELAQQRKEVERLNGDVCDLSKLLSETELNGEDASEVTKGEQGASEVEIIDKEVPALNEHRKGRDGRLHKSTNERFVDGDVTEIRNEAKELYKVVDNALNTLQNIQSLVQQCPPLAKLQRDFEEFSFQTSPAALVVPDPDRGANTPLVQAIVNLEIANAVDTTA